MRRPGPSSGSHPQFARAAVRKSLRWHHQTARAGYRLLLLLRDTSMVQLGPDCCYIMLALMNLIGNDHFIILLSNKTTPKEEITRKNHVISDELQTSLFSLWF